MEDNLRFADTGDSLLDMATHFIVACPKCNGRAEVIPHLNTWRLKCSKCFHVEEPGHWYGAMTAYVNVKCRECRQQIIRKAVIHTQTTKLHVKCENCGDECLYDASITKHPMHHGLMCDPVFGLPLWLQNTFGDDVFWAYHYDHLGLLEQYVAAKLRERGIHNKGSKNSLMFSRLPDFIKKAGNRKPMLKLIKELKLKT